MLCLEVNSENMMFQFIKCIRSKQRHLYSEFIFKKLTSSVLLFGLKSDNPVVYFRATLHHLHTIILVLLSFSCRLQHLITPKTTFLTGLVQGPSEKCDAN